LANWIIISFLALYYFILIGQLVNWSIGQLINFLEKKN